MTKPELVIRNASPAAVGRVYSLDINAPALAYLGEVDGRPVGAGGLAWISGRAWVWFQADAGCKNFPLAVVRMARRMIAMAGALGADKVYVARDERHTTSAKLLKVVGFAKTDETFNGHEVWVSDVRA